MREVREVSAIQADKLSLMSCPALYEGSISSFVGKLTELSKHVDKLALLK